MRIFAAKAAPTFISDIVGAAFLYMDVLISRRTGRPGATSRDCVVLNLLNRYRRRVRTPAFHPR